MSGGGCGGGQIRAALAFAWCIIMLGTLGSPGVTLRKQGWRVHLLRLIVS